MQEQKGLYLAVLLSIIVIFITNFFFKKDLPEQPAIEAPVAAVAEPAPKAEAIAVKQILSTKESLSQDQRIAVSNSVIEGSLRVKGARFDNLTLNKYRQTLDKTSPNVELLAPAQTEHPYYAEFGWTSTDKSLSLPGKDTVWSVRGSKLTPNSPVILEWNNGQGLKFINKFSLDENYMFAIEQSVENNTAKTFELYPYALVSQNKPEASAASSVVHEGFIGVFDGSLKEEKLKDSSENKKQEFTTAGGWAGFSDRYWFTSIILDKTQSGKFRFANPAKDSFQVDYLGSKQTLAADSVVSEKLHFYAGAKEIKLIDTYAKKMNIDKFDLNIDFGWYYFLTKPFFYILDFLYGLIGNMGWAILVFAALLRLVMFPIAGKSYESMSKMKKLQPKMKELQEKYKDNKLLLQQHTMELYKKEKINPASGCLPILIQIPVFFSLFKVLNIAIEIRHAPFIGWIKDLSAPDPLTISVITHLPIPSLLDIGVWPILMGITMFIQQKLNPAPANKDQARMFAMMPIIFTFMMGHFASGLVIYWTLSNVLSIIQQKTIMKKYGVS